MIQVGIAYATSIRQVWHYVDLFMGATASEAITASGILNEFPEIDLKTQKIGVFGEIIDLDSLVQDGDRVEIYRSIIIDPEKLERKKYRMRKIDPVIDKRKQV